MNSYSEQATVDRSFLLGVRHGKVENHTRAYFGNLPGFHLSSLGRLQSQAVGGALKDRRVTAVYSSPLERAVETAEIIASAVGANVSIEPRLIEWRFWESVQGREPSEALRTEIRETRERLVANPDDTSHVESFSQLRSRLRSWVEDVRHSLYGVVLVVTHVDALGTLSMDMLESDLTRFWDVRVGYGQVIRLLPNPSPYTVEGKDAGDLLQDVEQP